MYSVSNGQFILSAIVHFVLHDTSRARLEDFPVAALAYAVTYGYTKIANKAAPLTLGKDSVTMSQALTTDRGMYAWASPNQPYIAPMI